MSIITTIKSFITKYKVNKNDASKRAWLRAQGAIVGKGTRFIGNASLGTEPFLVEVGEDCLISSNVMFLCHDGGVKVLNALGYFGGERMDKMARIKVGNNCFLGRDSKILGGVTIGDNVIIGTGSIVTKDIPSNVVAAGMPARVICTIDEYYQKNKARGVFYPTPTLPEDEKVAYLKENVAQLSD